MELIQYYRLLRRWLWFVVLAAFIGGSISFLTRVTQPARYQTHAKIAIGGYLDAPNPNSQEIRTGFDLAQTYSELVHTYNVLNGVVESLNLPFDTESLNRLISTRIISGTSLLEISVTHTDPVLAADITNEIAIQLIEQSPTNLTLEQQDQVNLLNEEIAAQRTELQSLREQLADIDASLAPENIGIDARNFLREQRGIIVDQINTASSNVAQFTNTIASFQSRTNSIEIVESARIPTLPVGSSLFSTVILGALVGGALAFGAVLTYEYINDTFRNADETTRTLNVPVLGVISKFGKKTDSYSDRLINNMSAFSKASEEYRTLRTNLLYTSDTKDRIFIVCSASPEEGKTVTASNLAVSMALSGLNVLLIDADLRRPKVHEAFDLENHVGLSSLLAQRPESAIVNNDEKTQPIEPMDSVLNEDSWRKVMQRTAIPNLYVIPSGFSPVNPSELLGSALMKRWMISFRKASQLDVVIFDSPPVLAVSDSAVLAASTKAKVVLVIQANGTRRESGIKAKERFEQIGVEVVGVVLNRVDLRDEDYYGYNYGYYYNTPRQETES